MQRPQFRIRTFMILIAAAAAVMGTARLVLWLLATPQGQPVLPFVWALVVLSVLTGIAVGVQIGIIKLVLLLNLPSVRRKGNAVSANRGRSEPKPAQSGEAERV